MTKKTDNKAQVLAFVGSGRRKAKKNPLPSDEKIDVKKEVKNIENNAKITEKPIPSQEKARKKSDGLRKKQIGLVVTPELFRRAKYTAWINKKSLNSFIFDLLDQNSVPIEEVEES